MKNLILIAIFAAVSFGAYAEISVTDYVVTDSGISYFVDLRYGLTDYLIGKTDTGEKVRFERDEIKSFRKDGKVFTKMNQILNNKATDNYVFMQEITYENDAKLYAYTHYNSAGQLITDLYVFKGDEYVMPFNEKNSSYLLNFFSKNN